MTITLTDHGEDRTVSLTQLQAQLGLRPAIRTQIEVYYSTPTSPAAVYYTALHTDGSVLTARTQSGVTFANGLWAYSQSLAGGVTDFIAVWDEGDPDDYVSEGIVVDT